MNTPRPWPKNRAVVLVSEAADYLHVSHQHILDLIDEGRIGAINVGGGARNHWRIPVSEIERFMARTSSLDSVPSK